LLQNRLRREDTAWKFSETTVRNKVTR
jgi:hypothetical protein